MLGGRGGRCGGVMLGDSSPLPPGVSPPHLEW
eukprot:gene27174-biopygen17719